MCAVCVIGCVISLQHVIALTESWFQGETLSTSVSLKQCAWQPASMIDGCGIDRANSNTHSFNCSCLESRLPPYASAKAMHLIQYNVQYIGEVRPLRSCAKSIRLNTVAAGIRLTGGSSNLSCLTDHTQTHRRTHSVKTL